MLKYNCMDFPKIAGWLLLIVGIIIIGWTLMFSYNIFTGETPAPQFFEMPKEEALAQEGEAQDIEAQIEKMIGEQIKGLIPLNSLPQLLNLAIWSMLAFILIFGGSQISGLGIKLIKK